MSPLQSLRRLFGGSADEAPTASKDIVKLLGPGHVVVLSAACCDAMSSPKDDEMAANLAQAMELAGGNYTIALATLTDTQKQLRAHGTALEGIASTFRDQLSTLFQTQGLAAFPLLLVEGQLAFYGGVPSPKAIAQRLTAGGATPETGA
ncbi:hypothetical protein ACVNIS_08360 [Sphaerotilaceae bacterium SBD11-9]